MSTTVCSHRQSQPRIAKCLLFVRSHVRNRAKSHLCTCMWGSDRLRAGRQEVGKCSTRGESWGMYITFASAKIANKAEPTLALKPRGDVTRNPKQGYQWPQKRTCVRQKLKKKKKKKNCKMLNSPMKCCYCRRKKPNWKFKS